MLSFFLSDSTNYCFCRAQEVKEHPYFKGIDWGQVYRQKYTPPLIPPKGEVNAADAFDIGSFDEEDTKGIKVTQFKNHRLLVFKGSVFTRYNTNGFINLFIFYYLYYFIYILFFIFFFL